MIVAAELKVDKHEARGRLALCPAPLIVRKVKLWLGPAE